MLDTEKLTKILCKAYEMSTIPKDKPLPVGSITDPDKSVRWNQKIVEESREKYLAEQKRLRMCKEKAIQEAKELYVYPYIKDNLDVSYTEEGIHFLYATAYSYGHGSGIYSIVSKLDQLIDVLNDMERFKN